MKRIIIHNKVFQVIYSVKKESKSVFNMNQNHYANFNNIMQTFNNITIKIIPKKRKTIYSLFFGKLFCKSKKKIIKIACIDNQTDLYQTDGLEKS